MKDFIDKHINNYDHHAVFSDECLADLFNYALKFISESEIKDYELCIIASAYSLLDHSFASFSALVILYN